MSRLNVSPKNNLEFFTPDFENSMEILFASSGISAGLPSNIDSSSEQKISLDHELVKDKKFTFYAKVSGQSMVGAGLDDGDLLVVNKRLVPKNGQIAVCYIDGEFTVKRLQVNKDSFFLCPENPDFEPIPVYEEHNFQIWGVVTHVIKKL